MSRTPYTVGDRVVPSVTTILDRFGEGASLVHWAWQRGRDGLPERDDSAATGTLVHAHIEARLRGHEPPDLEDHRLRGPAWSSIAAWEAWRRPHTLRPLAIEERLTSSTMLYGGTPDLVCELDGTRTVVDWKTSSQPRATYPAQVAAYALLWNEHNPGLPVEHGCVVLLDRDGGGWRQYPYGPAEMVAGAALFTALRAAWDCAERIDSFYDREG